MKYTTVYYCYSEHKDDGINNFDDVVNDMIKKGMASYRGCFF